MAIACFNNTGLVPSMIFIVGWFILFIMIAATILTLQENYIEVMKVALGNYFKPKGTHENASTIVNNEEPPPNGQLEATSSLTSGSPGGRRIRLDFFMKRRKSIAPSALESMSVPM